MEAEQALLGGLLLDAVAWDNIADVVTSPDFYRPDHQLIFEAIANLVGEGKPCDVVTVSQELERTGKLEAAGGLAYLSNVARDTPTAANVRAYADIVRERSLLRQLIRAGTDIAEACTRAGFNVERSEVRLPHGPLRMVGEHTVDLHLHADIDVPVHVTIVAEE